MPKRYTSKDILGTTEDARESVLMTIADEHCSSGITIEYEMTDAELGWLDFIRGKYSIANFIDENLDGNILTLPDAEALSQALEDDCAGAGKAVMLSDDTALQAIFFYCYQEPEMAEDGE